MASASALKAIFSKWRSTIFFPFFENFTGPFFVENCLEVGAKFLLTRNEGKFTSKWYLKGGEARSLLHWLMKFCGIHIQLVL